ncbi:PepSY domain-containing protein [Henriciella sp. AS95]|uniref:PepSY domain-containing protein n=1 Tax=Henriciella sp. AS95 TaxID=3135782 RepID=UPI0031784210
MRRIVLALALSALPMTTFPAASAQGQWGSSFTADDARDARQRGEIKPLNQILRPIQNQYGGNMRKFVGLFDQGGRKVYIIDWVTRRGELVQFTIDAESGRVISVN